MTIKQLPQSASLMMTLSLGSKLWRDQKRKAVIRTKRGCWSPNKHITQTHSEVFLCSRTMSEEIVKRRDKIINTNKLAKCMKHDTTGCTNARRGTLSQSLQATTIRVEASYKTQLCNNPPVLKYLWASAYNPPPLLYYLSAEMIQPLEVCYIDTFTKLQGHCALYSSTARLNKVNKNLQSLQSCKQTSVWWQADRQLSTVIAGGEKTILLDGICCCALNAGTLQSWCQLWLHGESTVWSSKAFFVFLTNVLLFNPFLGDNKQMLSLPMVRWNIFPEMIPRSATKYSFVLSPVFFSARSLITCLLGITHSYSK